MPKHKVLSEFNIVKGPRYKRNRKKFQVGKTNDGPTQRKKRLTVRMKTTRGIDIKA